jgi:dihydrofolate synthase/folylpolyglutamate synthase
MGQDFHCHPATEANSMAEDSQRPGEYAVANWFHASGLIRNVGYELRDLEIAVFGHHQQLNASLATAAVQVLAADGWPINAQHVRQGLQTAQLDGRTEILTRDPTIVVDLAHNVASATALAETLQWKVPGFATAGCRRLIFAASREKDVQGMLEPLARIFDQICLTQFTSNPRGMPVQQLAQIAGQVSNPAETEWLTMPDSRSAWQWCRKIMGKEDFTCITGSVFLVAELRPRILQIANDR